MSALLSRIVKEAASIIPALAKEVVALPAKTVAAAVDGIKEGTDALAGEDSDE